LRSLAEKSDMSQQNIDKRGGKYREEANPVNHRETNDIVYDDEYRYNQVYMEFDPDEVFVDGADTVRLGTSVLYKYGDKPAVKITKNGVYTKPEVGREQAERQSYFVLSQLEAAGYVSGWSMV